MNLSNKISRLFGHFASYEFPSPLQNLINAVYVKIFHIELGEFAPASSYASLNALFTRALTSERTINPNPIVLVAPCDSLITQMGKSTQKNALQIKGMEYSVEELLGQKLDREFYYINFYLSPKDYHRYHAPCDMEIYEVRYFGGELLPVNLPSLQKNQSLFARNERVVVVGKTSTNKWLYFVAIGALNVGSIVMHFESRVESNAKSHDICYTYRTPITIKKGEELGMFKMGSTIVLFMEQMIPDVHINEKVKFAQDIGTHT
ncbi:phosphatidylserine decarboxylase [Helicobacter sp. MIT 03-1614]|nr:phosphatidylserine decarboxylase [Helicobacter sp. MIT 03-1614]TLD90565.1 phosphatidylserine decarboxylase [Helicobacter sp. MIT 03-1614]